MVNDSVDLKEKTTYIHKVERVSLCRIHLQLGITPLVQVLSYSSHMKPHKLTSTEQPLSIFMSSFVLGNSFY